MFLIKKSIGNGTIFQSLSSRLSSSSGTPLCQLLSTSSSGPSPPKRPPAAYMLFMNENREKLKVSNPGLPVTSLAKLAGEKWRELPEYEKQVYNDRAKRKLDEYKQTYEGFLNSLSPVERQQMEDARKLLRQSRKKLRKKRLVRKMEKPKARGCNAYSLYIQEHATSIGDTPFGIYIQGMAQKWKQMPIDDKQPYMEKAAANRIKYKDELVQWEQRMIEEGHSDLVRRSSIPKPQKTKTKKSTKRKTATKAKKTSAKGGGKKKGAGKGKGAGTGKGAGKGKGKKAAKVDEDTDWMREE